MALELVRRFFKSKTLISSLPQPFRARDLFGLFDIFYICFDEPNRQENWNQIKKHLPQAQKVEGVVGFDKALKTCAKKSKTDYFFVIDGDNQLLPGQFNQSFHIENLQDDWVLSWASLNSLNALTYGNGGLKLWPKEVALKINSHENAGVDGDQTDYCFVAKYFLIDQYVTETKITSTHKQAFRAGFREGVKMSLSWGKQVDLNKENFEEILGSQNRKRLQVWCEAGSDVHNGAWAILGARMGLYYNAVQKFDYRVINSYEWIDQTLQKEVIEALNIDLEQIESVNFDFKILLPLIEKYGDQIREHLGFDLEFHSPYESLNFKRNFQNPERWGLLCRSEA